MFGTSCYQQRCAWRNLRFLSDIWPATSLVIYSKIPNWVGLTSLGKYQARTSVQNVKWSKHRERSTATSATSVSTAMKVTASGLTTVSAAPTATLTSCLSFTFGFAPFCSAGPQWVLTPLNTVKNQLGRPAFIRVCAFIATTRWFTTWFAPSTWSFASSTCSGHQFTCGIKVQTTAVMRPHTRGSQRNSALFWLLLKMTALTIQTRMTQSTRS